MVRPLAALETSLQATGTSPLPLIVAVSILNFYSFSTNSWDYVDHILYSKGLITTYCDQAPTKVAQNSLVAGNFTQTLGSQATLMCAYGYTQPSSNGTVACSAYNSSFGIWNLSNNISCNSMPETTYKYNKTRSHFN